MAVNNPNMGMNYGYNNYQQYGYVNPNLPQQYWNPYSNGPVNYSNGTTPYQQPNNYGYSQSGTPSMNSQQYGAKMVNSASEIMPNDVPMDGRMYLFMLVDGSRIFGKRWSQEGRLETTVYSPEQVIDISESSGYSNDTQKIMERLNQMDTAISNLAKDVYSKQDSFAKKPSNRKEMASE